MVSHEILLILKVLVGLSFLVFLFSILKGNRLKKMSQVPASSNLAKNRHWNEKEDSDTAFSIALGAGIVFGVAGIILLILL